MRRLGVPFRRLTPLPLPAATASASPHPARRAHGGHGHSHGHSLTEDFSAGMSPAQIAECQRVTILGASTNITLSVAQMTLGTHGGSYAMVAEGMHSFVDVLSDGVAFMSIQSEKWQYRRCRFPFGLGRLQSIGAVFVSSLLVWFSAGLLFASFRRVATALTGSDDSAKEAAPAKRADDDHDHCHSHDHGHSHQHGHSHFADLVQTSDDGSHSVAWAMVAVAIGALLSKETLYRIARRVGERNNSKVLIANAYHHRADAWSAGVALIGVLGRTNGLPIVDALAAIVVACTVGRIGLRILWTNVLGFFDYQGGQELDRLRGEMRKVNTGYTDTVTAAAAASAKAADGDVALQFCASTDARLRDFVKVSDAASEAVVPQQEQTVSCTTPTGVATTMAVPMPTASPISSVQPTTRDVHVVAVNQFATHHGTRYILHGTLLCRPSTHCAVPVDLEVGTVNAVRAALPGAKIFDTYFKLVVCETDDEESFRHAAALVCTFHALNTADVFPAWAERRLVIACSIGHDCHSDLAAVARLFRCELELRGPSAKSGGSCTSCNPRDRDARSLRIRLKNRLLDYLGL